ncbi:YcxB family protein [Foetidibacter luteolus]|uniref:YcxB family protein n=1 Tax=Foetidibacter luteolus TaxID=2608880 RepID=UPI00129AE9DA|nr:YcxB family protein [Foetidibacter luteolus]
MQHSFSYNKKQVIQGLRYHFITRPEIRALIIIINVFAIGSAILYGIKKIRPEPFLLGSCLWLLIMAAFWYVLPNAVYNRHLTFKESFIIYFNDSDVRLEGSHSYVDWNWKQFTNFFESPNFFHLYFSTKSFFLVPKDNMSDEYRHELRGLLNSKIKKK